MPVDRDIVAVYQEESRTRCKDCGTWQWEWDENTDAWHPDHHTCQGCRRVQSYMRDVMAGPGTHDGVKFALYRTGRED